MLLGDMVETDDAYTGSHSRTSSRWPSRSATRWAWTAPSCATSSSARCCTTSARSRVPKEIINKPGKLTAEEWGHQAPHDRRPADARARRRRARRVGAHRARHHERWDGGGYPDGLAGDAIPIEARISAPATPSAR